MGRDELQAMINKKTNLQYLVDLGVCMPGMKIGGMSVHCCSAALVPKLTEAKVT